MFKNSVYSIVGIYAAFRDLELMNKTFETEKMLLSQSYPIEEQTWNEIDRIYNEQGFVAAFEEIT